MTRIAPFMFAGALALGVGAASAKTVTVPQKDNDRVVAGVSGGAPGKNMSPDPAPDSMAAKPSKKTLKASKVRTPPPLHDPN